MKYEIKAEAGKSEGDIHINDFIGDWIDGYWGFGVTSKAFIKAVDDLPESVKHVRLHINSPGGDVVAANHIANTIRDQVARKGRTFEGLIEGAAFSAATILTSATNPTKIADNGLMMVHDPWGGVVGNSRELRKAADLFDKVRDTIVAAYRWKSSLSEKKLKDLMAAETWMDAAEAIANGFANEKIEGVTAAALFDLDKLPKNMLNVPEKYQARVQALLKPQASDDTSDQTATSDSSETTETETTESAPEKTPEQLAQEAAAQAAANAKEIVEACTKAGVADMAADFLAKNTSLEDVKARLAEASQIRDICAAAGFPNRASDYIKGGIKLEEVRAKLLEAKIALDKTEIDNTIDPNASGAPSKPAFNSAEIYSAWNKKPKGLWR